MPSVLVQAGRMLLVGCVLTAGVATAEGAADDELTLKTGSILRCTVISIDPGVGVKIQEMGATAPRVLPWSDVADVERGKYAPKGGLDDARQERVAEVSTIVPPPPSPRTEGVVALHVASTAPARILRHASPAFVSSGSYASGVTAGPKVICEAPCDEVIDGREGATFTVSGAFPSRDFTIGDKKGDLTLTVAPGSDAKLVGGALLTTFGAVAMTTAFVTLGLGAHINTTPGPDNRYPGNPTPFFAAGGVTLGAGIGAAIVGVVLLATGSTKIHLDDRSSCVSSAWYKGEF